MVVLFSGIPSSYTITIRGTVFSFEGIEKEIFLTSSHQDLTLDKVSGRDTLDAPL